MSNRLNGPNNPKDDATGSILHKYAIKQTHEDRKVTNQVLQSQSPSNQQQRPTCFE